MSVWTAFGVLWERKELKHIALTEIESYARMHTIYDVEIFAELILASDKFVHQLSEKMTEEKKALGTK